MTDCYRAVFVEQKHCHRLADYVTSADYNAVFAAYFNVVGMKHLHYACRRAWKKIILAEHNFADIYGMERVNIFKRTDCLNNSLVIKVFRQRKLNKNTVDILLIVESFNKV